MRFSAVALLSDRPRERAWRVALVGVAALVVFTVLDAALDAFVVGTSTWLDEVLHPGWSEAWMRVLVAALLALAFALWQQRARLRLLATAVAEAPDGVQISDLAGHIAYSNRAVEDIYGFTPEELHGKHVNSMNADPEFASRVILPAIRLTGRWTGELEVKHKDGRTFPIWLTTAVVVGARGQPVAAVGIIRDLTERRRAEEQLRAYARRLEEATRLKDLFADILRHDLLGPLTAIRMGVETLRKREPGDLSARTLDTLRRACERLTDLVESAARYARISSEEELELAVLDLAPVLREVVRDHEVAAQDREVRIALDAAGELPVHGNPVVAEVFANLLSNALKYGPAGGTIDVRVDDAGDRWIVAVADEGPGIPDPDKQRIFTRFERLEREGVQGTGLGLAIAKRVVELHRGEIWVEDAAGGGSVFKVALPKASASAGAAVDPRAAAAGGSPPEQGR